MLDKSTAKPELLKAEPRPTRNALSHKEAVTLALEMAKVCSRGEDGFATYAEGWSDDRLRAHVNAILNREISARSVKYCRIENFGRLRAMPAAEQPEASEIDELRQKVESLERVIKELCFKLGERDLFDTIR